MLYLDRTPIAPPGYGALYSQQRDTPTLQYWSQALQEGFEYSGLGLAINQGRKSFGEGNDKLLSEEEWRASDWYEPDIPWDPNMTQARARVSSENYRRRRYREALYDRYNGGLMARAAGFGASMLGALPSPESWALWGVGRFAGRAASALGRIGRGAVAGGAEGLAGAAVTQPFLYSVMRSEGENYTILDAAADMALGAFVGGAVGGIGGYFSRNARIHDSVVRQAGRLDSLQNNTAKLDALADAMASLAENKPVDVKRFVGGLDASRRKLLNTAARISKPEMGVAVRVTDDAFDIMPREGVDESPVLAESLTTESAVDLPRSGVYLPVDDVFDVPEEAHARAEALRQETPDAQVEVRQDAGGWHVERKLDGDLVRNEADQPLVFKSQADAETWQAANAGTPTNVVETPNGEWLLHTGSAEDAAALADGWQGANVYRSPGAVGRMAERERFAARRRLESEASIDRYLASRSFATEQPDRPSFDLPTATSRVGKQVDELDTLVEDAGLDIETGNFPELDEVDEIRAAGGLNAEDEADLKAAEELVRFAKLKAEAFQAMAVCPLRYDRG